MADLGAPKVTITFKEKASTAVARSERGIVLLMVKDTIVAPLVNPIVVTSENDIPESLGDTTKAQIRLARLGYTTAPKKVLVYCMGIAESAEKDAVDTAYTAAKKAVEDIKWNYVAIPTVQTDGQAESTKTWIKELRDTKKKKVKAVLPNTAGDHEGIINYAIDENVYTETQTKKDGTVEAVDIEYTAEQYCARIAGLIAGTPLDISCTYAVLPELTSCTKIDDLDEAVNEGKFVVFFDGEKIKTNRAVNSLLTTVSGKGDGFKKIKIVDAMDMINDDITTTVQDVFIGKYPNTYDNRCVLLVSIREYFAQLVKDGVVDTYDINFNLDKIKEFLKSKGESVDDMTDEEILKMTTGSHVYISGQCKILDCIEDVDLDLEI